MNFYFKLQFKIAIRQIRDLGINPILFFLISLSVFILISEFIFKKGSKPEYIFSVVGLLFISFFTNPNKSTFLKSIFTKKDYIKIRLLESSILILPFVTFLIVKRFYFTALILLGIGMVGSTLLGKSRRSFVMPSPFSNFPYEFTIGYRKYYGIIFMLITIGYISLLVGNETLGICSLAGLFLICMNFYAHTEPVLYVFIYAQSPDCFLLHKIKVAVLHSSYIFVPLAIPLIIIYPTSTFIILLVILVGLLNVIISLLGKYSNFPNQIKLGQILQITFGVFVPPLLLILIPHFYLRAKDKLKYHLI